MSRLYALANLSLDLPALKNFIEQVVAAKPPVFQGQSKNYGGWSVTSGTGDYRDGWQSGLRRRADGALCAVEPESPEFRDLFPIHPRHMRIRTELYVGPIKDLMQEIERRCARAGALPSRARLARLDGGEELPFHIDSSVEQWRLHVPILTNPGCFFEWDLNEDGQPDERLQMRAGEAWFVRVDQRHRFVNTGG